MKVDTVPGDRLINAAKRTTLDGEPVVRSDTLLRAVRIRNTLDSKVSLRSITFRARADGRVLQSISYDRHRIEERAQVLVPLVEVFEANPDNERGIFGTAGFWGRGYCGGTDLKPKESTGLTLEHVVVVAPDPLEALDVAVEFEVCGEVSEVVRSIPVTEYANRNRYILPVQGSWLVVNNWDDLHGHRDSISQEFAIDLIQPFEDGLFPRDLPQPQGCPRRRRTSARRTRGRERRQRSM